MRYGTTGRNRHLGEDGIKLDVKQVYWLAGFLDGEGCFCNSRGLKINATQTDFDLIEHVHRLLGGGVYFNPAKPPRRKTRNRPARTARKRSWRWELSGAQAAGVMMTIYPLMCKRRRAKIREVLSIWRRIIPRELRKRCPKGHLYNKENTRTRSNRNSRECQICSRRQNLESQAKRAEHVNTYHRSYRAKNLKRVRAYEAAYRAANVESVRAYKRRWREKQS